LIRTLCFCFLLLVCDVVSKLGAILCLHPLSGHVYPFGGVGIFPDFLGISFSLNYVVNSGAAWGMFPGHSGLLFLLRFAVIVGLVIYLVWGKKSAVPKFPLWLVVTGAVGNAIDYSLYGHVIDFFHFVFWGYSFPVFNLADSYITLGVFSLLFFSRKEQRQIP